MSSTSPEVEQVPSSLSASCIRAGDGWRRHGRSRAERQLVFGGDARKGVFGRESATPLSVALVGNLSQRLLEHRTRLSARDQVLAINDYGRHRVNPDLLPEPLSLSYLFRELPTL
jgi:hypothetical protein